MKPTEIKPEEESKATLVAYREEYSGLIPHPRLMREWNDLIPGSATQLFNRFEAQSDHRMKMESSVIRGNNFKQYVGPIFAFIITMTALGGGIYTALQGHPLLGGSLSFSGLAMLVAAFLVSTYKSKEPNNRDDKK